MLILCVSPPYVGLCPSVSVSVSVSACVRLPPSRGRRQRMAAAADEHPGARVSQV